jgi:hypothetical protein
MDSMPIAVIAANAAPMPATTVASAGPRPSFSSVIAAHTDSAAKASRENPASNQTPAHSAGSGSKKAAATGKHSPEKNADADSANPSVTVPPLTPGVVPSPLVVAVDTAVPTPEANSVADAAREEATTTAAVSRPTDGAFELIGQGTAVDPATTSASRLSSKLQPNPTAIVKPGDAGRNSSSTTVKLPNRFSVTAKATPSDPATLTDATPTEAKNGVRAETPENLPGTRFSSPDLKPHDPTLQFLNSKGNPLMPPTTTPKSDASACPADLQAQVPVAEADDAADTEKSANKTEVLPSPAATQDPAIRNQAAQEPAAQFQTLVSELRKSGTITAVEATVQATSPHTPLPVTGRSAGSSRKASIPTTTLSSEKVPAARASDRVSRNTERPATEHAQSSANDAAGANGVEIRKQGHGESPDPGLADQGGKAGASSDTQASGPLVQAPASTGNTQAMANQSARPTQEPQHQNATAAPSNPTETAFGTTGVSSAKLIDRLGQSELIFGVKTRDLGHIEVSTTLDRHQVSATISVERGDLGRALATELPGLNKKFADLDMPLAKIVVHDQSASTSTGSERRSQHEEARQAAPPARYPHTEREIQVLPVVDSYAATEGLSIRI